jgi:Protein of unknown function (DUF3489)
MGTWNDPAGCKPDCGASTVTALMPLQPKENVMKLTDSQLVILSSAARRDDGTLLPLPRSVKLNKGATTIVFKSLLKHKLVDERVAMPGEACWREADDDRFALVIAEAGLKALGVEKPDDAKQASTSEGDRQSHGTKLLARQKGTPVREGSKLSLLVGLLSRKTGATVEEAAEATGWQHHSIRGAISGALKKKMGLTVTSAASEGRGRVYRIEAQS